MKASNKKKSWKISRILFLLTSLIFVAAATPGLAVVKLKLASETKLTVPQKGLTKSVFEVAVVEFVKLVSERSKGEIKIDAFYGTKGAIKELFGQTMMGTLDMMPLSTGVLSYFKGGENFSILWAPYLFQTPEEFSGWVDSDMARRMMGDLEKNMKIKILGPISWRTKRMLTTANTPIWSMADVKGVKFRTPPSRIFTEAFKSWGAIPTPMPFPELFMALKQDVVQGQDNGFDIVIGYQFYTVQNYMSLTDHMMSGFLLAMNMKKWKSLSTEQQELIQNVRREVLDWQKPLYKRSVDKYLSFAAAKGMKVVIPDLTGFRKTSRDLNLKLDANGKLWEKGLYEKVEKWLIKNYRQ